MVKRIRVRVLENQTMTERESGREGMYVRGGEKVKPRNKLSSGIAGKVMSALCASMISVVSA